MNKEVIICVDDEQGILNSLGNQLQNRFRDQYDYEFAESAEEALELIAELEAEDMQVIMIITDQIMPGLKGDQFLVSIHQKNPKPIKVLLTGYSSLDSAVNAINNADLFSYLLKPWNEHDLLLTVSRGLERYHLQRTLEKQVETFRKFVPQQFLNRIAHEGIESIKLGSVTRERRTLVFSDIRGFTRFAENFAPAEVLQFLNQYFALMHVCIEKHGGFVDKFLGDAIMALFEHEDPKQEAKLAIQAAIAMQKSLVEFNIEQEKKGLSAVAAGIGIHSGRIVIGTVGSESRMDSTAIGDTVNVTSRLENLTKFYGCDIIVSEDSLALLKEDQDIFWRELDIINIMGKEQVTTIYQIFSSQAREIQPHVHEAVEIFHRGLHHYRRQEWEQSLHHFQHSLSLYPEDRVSQLYLDRCHHFRDNPPHDRWQGIHIFDHK
ncbi:adenylate/guanylate cyclase domain-containing protein [candidate division CSSED10-310 bacterium]|uniref:Adenylate/guanylate cyclase domain-containing protein n=1 Tax=candidate division CSSED10-310 bacterium TaxID=2855610 RepID=A0ABV6Z2C0_UNCC1